MLLKLSMSFHLQSDRQTEQINGVLVMYLRKHIVVNQTNWTKWLSFVEFCYSSIRHTSTKMTPFKIARSFEPLQPIDLALSIDRKNTRRKFNSKA